MSISHATAAHWRRTSPTHDDSLGVDAREEGLDANLVFSNKTRPDGSYRYDLRTRELTSLAAGNLGPLLPEAVSQRAS